MTLLLFFLAASIFDFEMTSQEKKSTGLSKLSSQEQIALQHWVDNHFVKREEPLAASASTQAPTLEENLNNGKYIRLSDNSLWEINPSDTSLTQSWITPVEIVVSQNSNSKYPYKLTNSLTGSSVQARRVQKVPPPTPDKQPSGAKF